MRNRLLSEPAAELVAERPGCCCADVDETVAQCSEIWTTDELCGGAILEMQDICGAGSAALAVDAEEVSRSKPLARLTSRCLS